MSFERAPLYEDIASCPPDGEAYWLRTEDGVRVRFAIWPQGSKGTVLFFSGRTEYIEKYGEAAAEFKNRGFAFASLDWRGQGLSDRPCEDQALCHVGEFAEFQQDVAAARRAISVVGAPEPVYLLAHSMGGCIGLRSLHEGLDVAAAVFSGPMWRIFLGPIARRIALGATGTAKSIGLGRRYVLGTNSRNYLHVANPGKNALTSDPDMFLMLKSQIEIRPELATGGPSYSWLNAALRECNSLIAETPPDYPALTLMGAQERVVDPKAVRIILSRWPRGKLERVPEARHEIMMENSGIREYFYGRVSDFFESF